MTSFNLQEKLKGNKDTQKSKGDKKIYNKDNVFDSFDISDLLNKDLLIPKTNIENFLYKKDIYNSNISSVSTNDISQSDKDQEEIISQINNTNHFNIEIEKLILTYKNGYEVPFINMYTPIKLIGQGHFGLVLSVINNQNNIKMAVKIIKKKTFLDEYYLSETELLNKLNHERIIKLYDVVNTEDYLFIFTELCLGGSLKDLIISRYNSSNNYFMKDSEVSLIIKNILQGVEYLTSNGIIHRDLKPENIMFRKENDINSLVLCDFGLAKENIGNTFLERKCGTLIFMAPEIIMNRPYDSLVDIWSIGIIMYILESGGSHPLYNSDVCSKDFMELIKNKTNINFQVFFPRIARNFFLKMCKYDPFFRYDAVKALNHPWIIRSNLKIPLTVFEDVERENKIKNFKNMLYSLICLRQFKVFYKRRNKNKNRRTLKEKYALFFKYKLMSPLLNIDKPDLYLNNIKETPFKENRKSLPPIIKPLSPKVNNNLYTYKSLKNLNIFGKDLKPRKLFSKEEKKNNINRFRYHLGLIKQKSAAKSSMKISLKKNNLSNDINVKQKKMNKNFSVDKDINLVKDKNKKKFRLYSSKKIFPYKGFIKKINFFNPKISSAGIDNSEKIISSFMHY